MQIKKEIRRVFADVVQLESQLGDPFQLKSAINFKEIAIQDENESYPEHFSNLLNELGLLNAYIPPEYGGKLKSVETLGMLMRVISRRDLTLSIAHGGRLLGLMPVWMSANETLKKEIADFILSKNKIALGLTEYDHGSDILKNEVKATKTNENEFVLTGEKWLISHATLGNGMILLAKTADNPGPRAFTLFFFNKTNRAKSSFYNLPKIPTMGVRGLDMSGIGFTNCIVKEEDAISEVGKGLDVVLKGLQFTRNLCTSFSLGAIDTVLRSVYTFTKNRELYGRKIIEIPSVKKQITDTYITIITTDCLATAINRCFNTLPAECSIYSAIAKGLIPEVIENKILEVSKTQGARHFLRAEYHNGIVQKMIRDNIVIGLGDGNTAVNLHSVILQLKLFFIRNRELENTWSLKRGEVEKIFDLNYEVPELDFKKFDITNAGKGTLFNGLFMAKESIEKAELEHKKIINTQIDLLISRYNEIKDTFLTTNQNLSSVFKIPSYFYDIAKDFCFIQMGQACINMFMNNDENSAIIFNDAQKDLWILVCLDYVIRHISDINFNLPLEINDKAEQMIFSQVEEKVESNQLFSLFDIDLGS